MKLELHLAANESVRTDTTERVVELFDTNGRKWTRFRPGITLGMNEDAAFAHCVKQFGADVVRMVEDRTLVITTVLPRAE